MRCGVRKISSGIDDYRAGWFIALSFALCSMAMAQPALKVGSVVGYSDQRLPILFDAGGSTVTSVQFDLLFTEFTAGASGGLVSPGTPLAGSSVPRHAVYTRKLAAGVYRVIIAPLDDFSTLPSGEIAAVYVSYPAAVTQPSQALQLQNVIFADALPQKVAGIVRSGLFINNTVSTTADTDQDGTADTAEVSAGRDPLNPYDRPFSAAMTTFNFDGTAGEWAAVPSFYSDPADSTSAVDFRRAWMANNFVNLFLAVENHTPWQSFTGFYAYLDTDGLRTTGFVGGVGEFPIGADFMISGFEQTLNLFRARGNGTAWDWELVGEVNYQKSGALVEMFLRRDTLGNPIAVRSFLQNQDGRDLYPNLVLSGGEFFLYQLDLTVPAPVIPQFSNPIATLEFDGNLTEWNALAAFEADPDDVPAGTPVPVDYRAARMAHDGLNFYFALTNDVANPSGTGITLLFDTDKNRATGYHGLRDNFPVGAEYMIQGYDQWFNVFRYTGTGTNWSWTYVSQGKQRTNGADRELFIRRAALGNPATFALFLCGDNEGNGGTAADYYPNSAALGEGYLIYNAVGGSLPNNPVFQNAFAGMSADGSAADWEVVTAFPDDPNDVAGTAARVDWRRGAMAHDDKSLYLFYENAAVLNKATGFLVLVDADQNNQTGFRGYSDDYPIGADYLIHGWEQSFNVFAYTGAGNDWAWTVRGPAVYAVNGTRAEISFRRALINNAASLRVFFLSDNANYGVTTEDYYPNAAILGTSYFVYNVTGTVADPRPQAAPVVQSVARADQKPLLVLDGTTLSLNGTGSTDPTGQPLTYRWDFGDGTPSSTTASTTHTYAAPGNYTVTLTVNNGTYNSLPGGMQVTVVDRVETSRGPIPGVDSSATFLLYYGNDFSQANRDRMKQFDVVVLDPNRTNCTPAVVAELQNAGTLVLGYISIGEEYKTPDTEPIAGDGRGPVYVESTTGQMVYENRGIASFYLDSWYDTPSGTYLHDTVPDNNGEWGGWYVMPNENWRWVLNVQRLGGHPGVFGTRADKAGLAQMAGSRGGDLSQRNGNFGFDGFFLDTVDTAGPYAAPGNYPWAVPAMRDTVKFIHDAYPDHVILSNRGIFFYQAGIHNPTFNIRPPDFTIRPYVNAVLFESYYLDSDPSDDLPNGESAFFVDNKNNIAPKLLAEANRLDGFTVFALDYMMNRGPTLYDAAIQETVVKNGWTEYLSERREIDTVTMYAADNPPALDTAAPVWTSTAANYNQTVVPRVGVQEGVPGPNAGEITVRWDVARDQTTPVRYNIYVAGNAGFTNPTKYANVPYRVGAGWLEDPVNRVANEYTLTGLAAGTYYVKVRAEDNTAMHYEEANNNVLSVTIGP